MKALFDTNILIDYLNGIEAAKDEINRLGFCYQLLASREIELDKTIPRYDSLIMSCVLFIDSANARTGVVNTA